MIDLAGIVASPPCARRCCLAAVLLSCARQMLGRAPRVGFHLCTGQQGSTCRVQREGSATSKRRAYRGERIAASVSRRGRERAAASVTATPRSKPAAPSEPCVHSRPRRAHGRAECVAERVVASALSRGCGWRRGTPTGGKWPPAGGERRRLRSRRRAACAARRRGRSRDHNRSWWLIALGECVTQCAL